MAYEDSTLTVYQWGQDATLGSTAVVHQIVGPRGKVGFVRDISLEVTTSLVGTTTVPEIVVGISSGDTTYGRYRLGTTASAGYGTGMHSASLEAIPGNPPRTLTDFAGHVVLDGGPLTTGGVAGGTYLTVVPKGRIPASPIAVANVINGAGNVPRIFLVGGVPQGLIVGQNITVQGVSGATGTNGTVAISAVDTTNGQWIETSGTFGGTYTTGGFVLVNVFVTSVIGSGSQAGGGFIRVGVEWVGGNP